MDEESSHASNAEIDLNKLFKDLRFEAGKELALSAGQPLSQARMLHMLGLAMDCLVQCYSSGRVTAVLTILQEEQPSANQLSLQESAIRPTAELGGPSNHLTWR